MLPRLKGGRGGDRARLRRDGFGLGAGVGGQAESRAWVCIFQFGSRAGTEAGDTACLGTQLDIPTPPLGASIPAAVCGPSARLHLALVEEQEAGPGA